MYAIAEEKEPTNVLILWKSTRKLLPCQMNESELGKPLYIITNTGKKPCSGAALDIHPVLHGERRESPLSRRVKIVFNRFLQKKQSTES